MNKSAAEQVNDLSNEVRQALAGKNPDVIGAVLADMVATYIISHHPVLREEVLKLWIATMRNLIPVNEKLLLPDGWPQ